jgi:hypothetical protein
VFPVRYELNFYIPEEGIIHSARSVFGHSGFASVDFAIIISKRTRLSASHATPNVEDHATVFLSYSNGVAQLHATRH